MANPVNLKKSPLFDFLNRRDDIALDQLTEDEDYINWNGVLMPMDYGDAEMEYSAIRQQCAICDVSPMRKIRIRGGNAGLFLDHLVTRPVSTLPVMRAAYTVLCDDDGNLKDDAIVYKLGDDDYLILPSDVDHRPYFESICARFAISDVSFTDCTDDWLGIAVQGPLSAGVMHEMGFDDVEKLNPFEIRKFTIDERTAYVARMGFTADLGYECWFDSTLADLMMERINSARSATDLNIPGYALTALQVCRMEGGFIVAGWDCATEIEPQAGFERSPYELGLGWLVNLDAQDFVGREALVEQNTNGRSHTFRYFSLGANQLFADGVEVFADSGPESEAVGIMTCSIWSWGLQQTIGNLSLRSEFADLSSVWARVGDDFLELTISRRPLISLPHRNHTPAALLQN